MMPVFTTRKVKNLLLDIGYNTGYQLDCNSLDIPVSAGDIILINRFRTIVSCYEIIYKKLSFVNRDLFMNNLDNFKKLDLFISQDYSKLNKKDKLIYDKIAEKIKNQYILIEQERFETAEKLRLWNDIKSQFPKLF
jgi:hypothetical protein